MNHLLKASFVFLFFLSPFLGQSQIVNIEDRRSQIGDTILWQGNLNVGFNLVQNGDAIFTFNGGINVEHFHNRHLFLSFTRFNLVRVDEKDFINDGFQHFRYNYRLNSRFTWELFTQAQYNEKINLRLRGLLGIGPRITLLPKSEKQRAFLGLLYMYEYDEEKQENNAGATQLIYFRDHRLSSYLSFRFELGENTVLANTSYYQPLLTDFSDLRLSSQTSLQIGITKKIKFNTTFSILYDSRVPEEVSNTIYSWRNGVVWEF